MLREQSKNFNIVQRAADLFFVLAAWAILYYLRFIVFEGEIGTDAIFLKAGFLLAAISAFFFSKEGLYASLRLSSRQTEVLKILRANLFSSIAFIFVLYFLTEKRLSRFVILAYPILSTVALIVFRMMVRSYLRKLRARGRNLRSFLLVGSGWMMKDFVMHLQGHPDAGIRFAGWIDSHGLAHQLGVAEVSMSLEEARAAISPDQIVIGYDGSETAKVQELLKNNFNDVVPITVLPDLSYSFVGYRVEYIAGLPALVVNQPDFSEFDLFLKRSLDFTASLVGLLVLSPVLLVIALIVKFSSRGPIFFGQERIGLDGKAFKMWKFRSMSVSAEKQSTWTVKNDPRTTAIGAILRKTSLDELPQLWNVLVGNMSLVGPRPEQTQYVAQFRNQIPAYMLRHKMKAGITGWAQVNGWRGDTSLNERIACDLYYIKNWSIWLDLKIIFLTFWKGFINKNAY